MLHVYGPLMPLRWLEEIRFWKTQEKEHTLVIRTLVPNLEPRYVQALTQWEGVFEKTEVTAGQWIEWAIRSQAPADPQLQHQLNLLLKASVSESNAFIELLLHMEASSEPIRSNAVVKAVIEHIIRESEYFLGVLKAMGGPAAYTPLPSLKPSVSPYPTEAATVYSPAYPMDMQVKPPVHHPLSGHSALLQQAQPYGLSAAYRQADPHAAASQTAPSAHEGAAAASKQVPERAEPSLTDALNATGEGSWSAIPPATPSTPGSPSATSAKLAPVPIGQHKLPPLPYAYDALEPYIDSATMKLHHDKHHQSYVDGLNKAEKMLEKARKSGDFELVKHWERELAFNGAGHYLHTIFWNVMQPKGGGPAEGPIAEAIRQSFGGFEPFKKQFSAAAEKVEGGGWAILVWSPRSHRLEILQAEKHQNLSQWDVVPLLPLDVWEHAYYLKYENERGKYIDAWWNLVNWGYVNDRFQAAKVLQWPPF